MTCSPSDMTWRPRRQRVRRRTRTWPPPTAAGAAAGEVAATKRQASQMSGQAGEEGAGLARASRSGQIGGADMTVQADAKGRQAAGETWYSRSPEEVAAALDVDPVAGLSPATAAQRLSADGPNALPEEQPKPGWRPFLDEYRSYMQVILSAAAVVSLLIKEWSTAVLLLVLTVLNAVVGLRQEGKAESAMNALKSMMKATARVRRGRARARIPPATLPSAALEASPPRQP